MNRKLDAFCEKYEVCMYSSFPELKKKPICIWKPYTGSELITTQQMSKPFCRNKSDTSQH